jgi:cell division protein FtsI (penicillin-binding protein 3)
MKLKEKRWIRFRIYLVACFFLLTLGVMICRAYQLQISEESRLEVLARAAYMKVKKLPPKRGTIYDRKGHELAMSVEAWSVYAHPHQIKNKDKVARQLARATNIKTRNIASLLKSDRRFVWITRQIPFERANQIKVLNLKGVGLFSESRRYYPNKEVAAHLIGFVGVDNQGLEGLEKKYDVFLKGPQRTLVQMKDALGRPFYIDRPVSSDSEFKNLYLTIDRDIQYKAQESLRFAVKKANAKSGHCVVLDPETGEILAMAVVPEFNPNAFSRYKPAQWRNRTVTDCYEPGSTVKAFLLAACLEEGILTTNSRFDCEEGRYKIGGHMIRDSHKHGIISVADIVSVSSNIGAIKMGGKLGYRKYYRYMQRLGFGSRTGVDLLGERKGNLRTAKDTRPVDQANQFFGQGLSVTSLQLATAMAAIANGGKLMRPYVVREIRDQKGRLLSRTDPKVIKRVFSPETAKKTSRVLNQVVGDKGTGQDAAIPGFKVAGKTGTSQKVDYRTGRYSKSRHAAMFVGFAPLDRPKLVVLVMIDEPEGLSYGGPVAGPVFKAVGMWTLNYLQINPGVPRSSFKLARSVRSDRDINQNTGFSKRKLPDFTGRPMRKVLKEARALGLEVVLEGTGLAFKQEPKPGVRIKDLNTVKISFRPPA